MEQRIRVLSSVADALFPPLKDAALESIRSGDDVSAQLLEFSGGSCDEYMLKVVETIETRLTPEACKDLNFLLRLLGSRWGTMLAVGLRANGWNMPLAFVDMPRPRREAILQEWSHSKQAKMRKAFKGLKSIIMSALFGTLNPDGGSVLLSALRYPIIDPARPPAAIPQAVAAEETVGRAITDLTQVDSSPGGVAAAGAALAANGINPTWPDKVRSPAVRAAQPQLVIKCDAVIVGSGAGGGVAAAQLAAAGLKVVVLEKATLVPTRDMTLREAEAFETMYENSGILSTEDGTLSALAGSTVGGGTRINWCASFKTPPHVRREWAEKLGLEEFASARYDRALDAVCARTSVHTGFQHSTMCGALRGGLEGLGVHWGEVPRNCLNADCSGHCGFGCARGYKQDMVNTYLSDACRMGCQVLAGVWADKVLLESNSGDRDAGDVGSGVRRKQRAAGLLALAGSRERPLRLAIKAPVVISAAGSIHSPALLLRSGISCRGNVGANLRLHPCTCVVGLFPSPEAAAAAMPEHAVGSCPAPEVGDIEELVVVQVPSGQGGMGSGSGSGGGRSGGPGASSAPFGSLAVAGSERRLVMTGAGQGPGSINCWEGTLMSIFSKQVAHWEENGYGALLYTPSVHPALFSVAAPWVSGQDFKQLLLQFPNQCTVLVLVRDQGSGRVVIDSRGQPRLHYTIAAEDQKSMVEGIELGLRTMAAAGAQQVMTLEPSLDARYSFDSPATTPVSSHSYGAGASGLATAAAEAGAEADGVGDAAAGAAGAAAAQGGASGAGARFGPGFEGFLEGVRQRGIPLLSMPLLSAHQMGTCRLGTSPHDSVLDPQGECWEVAGLYCCDASTFPTPTGLNPMVTIWAISYMLSEGIAERAVAALKRRGKWKGPVPVGASGRGLAYESASQARL